MARTSTTTQELSPVPLSPDGTARGRSVRGSLGRIENDRTPMEARSAAQVLDLGLARLVDEALHGPSLPLRLRKASVAAT